MTQASATENLHFLARRNLTPTATFFIAVAVLVAKWHERHRSRRVLASLDDHLLRDVGLTRDDAERESMRRFWDG